MVEMTKKNEIPDIALRIKQLRNARGWSQSVLAFHAKVTDGAIKMWETGKRFPRGKNLKNLAAALECTESDILDGFDTTKPISKTKIESKSDLILSIQSMLTSLDYDELKTIDASIGDLISLRGTNAKATTTK